MSVTEDVCVRILRQAYSLEGRGAGCCEAAPWFCSYLRAEAGILNTPS